MSDPDDPLDEVIRVEAVADWSRRHDGIPRLCIRAAAEIGDRWNGFDDHARLSAVIDHAPATEPIADAARRLHRTVALAAWIAIAVAAILGGLATAAALPVDRTVPTNVFWMLAGVLGVQSVLLLAWAIATTAAPRWRGPGFAAAFVNWVARAAASRASRPHGVESAASSEHPSAADAMRLAIRRRGRIETRTSLARWGLGLLTNSMWGVFNLASLAAALVLLGSRQYEFAWESTILGPESYIAIIDAVAWLPRQLGFDSPDAAAIAASRFDPTASDTFPPQSDDLRAAWSGLLIGSIVAYGVLPRFLLAGLCLWRRHAARRKIAVDFGDPAVVGLLEAARRAAPPSSPPADASLPRASAPSIDPHAATRPPGPAAIVGIEIEPPAAGWPPALDREIEDLGLVASGDDRRGATARLAASRRRPALLVAVCDASATPDRGVAATLRELAAAAAGPLLLVISGGGRLRERDSKTTVARRLEDWRALAAGFDAACIEIDLDHLTRESRSRLADAIASASDGDVAAPAASGHADLGASLRTIVAAVRGWHDESGAPRPPTPADEADLHRRIVRIFEGDGEIARWPFPPLSPADPTGSIRRAASRIESMLPNALRMRPKWLAAGAAAGALGCIAAATLVSPLAISALPVWSGLGGVIAGLLSARAGGDGAESPNASATIDFGPPVATAVLQAVLLAHQGRGEAAIGAALETALEPEDPPRLADADAVAAWIHVVEARLAAARREDEA